MMFLARRIASRETLPLGKILSLFLLAHLCVSSKISVHVEPVWKQPIGWFSLHS